VAKKAGQVAALTAEGYLAAPAQMRYQKWMLTYQQVRAYFSGIADPRRRISAVK
jgi:hypothetical protein